MDIEIEIGRSVAGAKACQVPSEFTRVSRHHATIHWHDGQVTIEDNGSTNGTFVNGKRVTSAQIRENDTVCLGSKRAESRCYQLDLQRIFASFPYVSSEPLQEVRYKAQSNDYSKEFEQVKRIYNEYKEKLSKMKRKANMRMQLPRVLLTSLPAIIGIVLMIKYGFGMMGFIAMSAGTVLGGLIGTLTMGRNSLRQEKMEEDLDDLERKYRKEYKCPKCGKEFGLNRKWKDLQEIGECPFGCGAKYV
jgi:DNA-directed RNA polymerase subunit RPC12/RpoP